MCSSDLLKGRSLDGGRASTEVRVHLEIYAMRADCMAIVHAHPIAATGLSIAGLGVPHDVVPEAAALLGPIAVAPFQMPGSRELAEAVAACAGNHNAILMSQHGAVTIGHTVDRAVERMETLERVARMVVVAHAVGTPRALPAKALEEKRDEFLVSFVRALSSNKPTSLTAREKEAGKSLDDKVRRWEADRALAVAFLKKKGYSRDDAVNLYKKRYGKEVGREAIRNSTHRILKSFTDSEDTQTQTSS